MKIIMCTVFSRTEEVLGSSVCFLPCVETECDLPRRAPQPARKMQTISITSLRDAIQNTTYYPRLHQGEELLR